MARDKLVCNLRWTDLFILPDSDLVWRKKDGNKTYQVKDGKRTAGYNCESLYFPEYKIWLPASQRVTLIDK